MTGRLLIWTPISFERRAVRRGLSPAGQEPAATVLRAGYGTIAAARRAAETDHSAFDQIAVMGVGAGLTADLRPGDLVVATSVGAIECDSAVLLAGELRRAGLRVHLGPVVTVDHLVKKAERAELAATGAILADMETAPLAAAAAAAGLPVVVVRAVSDGPDRPVTGIVSGGLAALRALRAAAPVVQRWAAACYGQPGSAQREVLLAGPRSFCAGVERAIQIVERALEQQGAPVYVRKEIVHNKRVVGDLAGRGAVFVDELHEVPDGSTVVFSAHGVSPAVRTEAAQRGLSVIDGTCPLVSKVHAEARRFAADGYTVAFIGHAGHEEVEGTLGEAPESMVLVQTPQDVAALAAQDKIAYLMQTTLSVDEAASVAGALRDRFPALRGPGSDDICYATTNRQAAVREVAAATDLVLVAGSKNSSNSVRLVETCERAGTSAYLIDDAADIQLDWLAGVARIGVTAGASAPPAVVSEIVSALSGLGPVSVSERVTTTESIRFGLPKEVRQ